MVPVILFQGQAQEEGLNVEGGQRGPLGYDWFAIQNSPPTDADRRARAADWRAWGGWPWGLVIWRATI